MYGHTSETAGEGEGRGGCEVRETLPVGIYGGNLDEVQK